MVNHTNAAVLGIFAIVAVSIFMMALHSSATGNYVAGGGGRYTYDQPKLAQMQPDEACVYAGFEAVYPQRVFKNEWGTWMSTCRNGNEFVAVPLMQMVIVP